MTYAESDALEMALPIAAELDRRGIPYAIGGALALGMWSDPRGTKDVDLNVFVTDGMFIGTLPNGMRLDVFTPSIDFSWEAERTRVRLPSRAQDAAFLSAEAIAIFKLLFFRLRDRGDLQVLVGAWPALDRAYVRRNLVEMFGEDDERVRFWDETVASQRLPEGG